MIMETAGHTPVAVAQGVSKRFHGTQALDDVSAAFMAGQVHAIIGENGAGKSTLIKILGGVHQPDSGSIRIAGAHRRLASPRDALAAGVVVIPQEMRIVPAQTVAENVMLGQVPMRRLLGVVPTIDHRRMRERSAELLARFDLHVDLDLPVGELGFAERQLVMIARALSHDTQLLILDEPTAALEAREVDRLFHVVDKLKSEGVAIIFISHRLEEVEALADVCTILRDGRVVDAAGHGVPDREDMIRMMTGRDLEEIHERRDSDPGEPILEVEHEAGTDPIDRGLALRRGEVVGLAGLLGSGMTELLRRIFGAEPGRITLRSRGTETTIRSPADAIARGFGLVPSDRNHGLVMGLTVRENIVLPNLARLSNLWRLDTPAIDRLVEELMETVDIRPRDPGKLMRELSGGNQQKVVFARWLAGHADVLLLDEPTHGIDAGAKPQIHRLMRRFAEGGGGIVCASSEMTEVLSISDTVIAMRKGEFVARISRDGEYNERKLRIALGG